MTDDKKYEIGQRIQRLRKQRGFSKYNLSKKADLSLGYIGDLESGRKAPGADTLIGLSTALRVSVDYILFGSEVNCSALEQSIARFDSLEQKHLKTIFFDAFKLLDDIPDKQK